MSAETLRRAAALMRERAAEPVAQPDRWPQGVGPALADLLDVLASVTQPDDDPNEDGLRQALAVARAYLGLAHPSTDPDG